jgi:hypothetical protein
MQADVRVVVLREEQVRDVVVGSIVRRVAQAATGGAHPHGAVEAAAWRAVDVVAGRGQRQAVATSNRQAAGVEQSAAGCDHAPRLARLVRPVDALAGLDRHELRLEPAVGDRNLHAGRRHALGGGRARRQASQQQARHQQGERQQTRFQAARARGQHAPSMRQSSVLHIGRKDYLYEGRGVAEARPPAAGRV